MANRIKKDDIVKIISGKDKGTTGKVLSVTKTGVLVEGVGLKTRHIRPTQLNPRGGTKEVHAPTLLHKIALIADQKSGKISRIGFAKQADGTKIRVARQLNNKEVK
ncbi:MAG: 50S ribosomal protein L24 [Candidatus Saccharimonas sp.]